MMHIACVFHVLCVLCVVCFVLCVVCQVNKSPLHLQCLHVVHSKGDEVLHVLAAALYWHPASWICMASMFHVLPFTCHSCSAFVDHMPHARTPGTCLPSRTRSECQMFWGVPLGMSHRTARALSGDAEGGASLIRQGIRSRYVNIYIYIYMCI